MSITGKLRVPTANASGMGTQLLTVSPKPLQRLKLLSTGSTSSVQTRSSISSKEEGGVSRGSSISGQSSRSAYHYRFIDQLNQLPRGTPPGKLKLDPLNVLTPYHKKLTTLEAQRIIGIIDELKMKCEIIFALPIVIKDLPKYKELLGPELTNLLEEHSVLLDDFYVQEKLYIEAVSPGGKSKQVTRGMKITGHDPDVKKIAHGDISAATTKSRENALDFLTINLPATSSSNVLKVHINPLHPTRSRSRSASDSYTSYASTLANYSEAEQQMIVFKLNKHKSDLEFSIRNVLRAFRNNERVIKELLHDVGPKKYKEGAYFLQCLSDMRDILLDRLLVSPSEQDEKKQFLAQIALQDRNNQLVIEKLEADLDLVLAERDRELMEKNEAIKTLQANLQVLEKSTEDDIRRAKTESEKQSNTDKRASLVRKQKYEADFKSAATQLNSNTEEHRNAEQVLRRKKFKIETEIENWIQKYDEELGYKQEEYEKVDTVYQQEKKLLVELEERFAVVEAEYKVILEKARREKNERDERTHNLMKKAYAVIAIQALWRSFRVRKALKNKQKKKGKKKSKKKGKK